MITENESQATEETNNVPMSWAAIVRAQKAQQDALLNALNSSPKMVSLQGGGITIDGVEMPNNELDVVVIGFVGESGYYDKPYDAANPSPPVCYSLYDGSKPAAPSDEATIKVNATCSGCPMKEWGSDPNGRGGKACGDHVRVAILPADLTCAEDVEKATVRYVKVPTMSVGLFRKYVKELDVTTGLPTFAFTTKMKTVRDPKSQFKLHWLTDRSRVFQNEEVLMALYHKKQQVDKDILFGYPKKEDADVAVPEGRRSKV